MAYSSLDDLKNKVDEKTLVQLTDTGATGNVDAGRVESVIAEADAYINSFVSKVYEVPMNPVPNIIKDLSATIAIHHLHMFRSIESKVWKQAFEMADHFLKKVSTGEVALEGAVKEPSPSGGSSQDSFQSADRRFSRDLLKDM